jgi:CheY-like chemotaxis protein
MNNESQTLIYQHPTTVVLIDDNSNFLNVVSEQLQNEGLEVLAFTDPFKAISAINQQNLNNPLKTHCCEIEEGYNNEMQVDLEKLSTYSKDNPNRNKEISVVICDYNMPELKGDDVFASLAPPYIQKLMLTGEADLSTAVSLLNNRIIDNFVKKGPTEGMDHLLQKVRTLQGNYFTAIQKFLLESVFTKDNLVFTNSYQKLVNHLVQRKNIIERYTINQNGSLLMLDKNGKEHWLHVASPEEMDGYYNIAYYAEAGQNILNKLQNHTHIPCLTPANKTVSPKLWDNYLQETTEIPGHFYYALSS